ncbi:uncharacterized protein EV420DRAFT_1482684 [Desarmillaria tabescens]|uniref:Uncharacterized protein n=1 Tax=Armillaria tabescens TaxID=1929756 RepID=A0AA39JXM9_ARMTA|nr:uncharacterized protein EV420DRAFT_1482684 [Desarmillaria tabescens]KAK0450477.1 hypothetical protein EV420DRAFT_1482684 [Desarmillaria tabescens]
MAPESMQIARFKAALALLRSHCKNGVYLPTIPAVLLVLKDGSPDFDAILIIDKENLWFLEGIMPLFDNKERFMKAYQEDPSLLREGAFGARRDCQNRKLLLELLHGSKPPDNTTLPGRATGWIHADREEKQAAAAAATAAANAQAAASSQSSSKPSGSLPKLSFKKTGKTVKSKATVGLDTDPETILVDEDVQMKTGEESIVVDLDSDESDSMSVAGEVPAKPTNRGCTTRKRRPRLSKRAASHSPQATPRTATQDKCEACHEESHGLSLCATVIAIPYCDVLGLNTSDPSYRKAVEVLEKQDRALAERGNKRICTDMNTLARHGELGTHHVLFPIAAWATQFDLQAKHDSLEEALKILASCHSHVDSLEGLQIRQRQLQADLELLVHCLESTVVAHKFCVNKLSVIDAKIDRMIS